MSSVWSSYRARWQGLEFPCAPELHEDGLWVHLRSVSPTDGFEEFADGLYLHMVAGTDCDMVAHIRTSCEWRGVPCIVHDERISASTDELLIEYTGGKVPQALELGLERIERGVYRGWVPREEVRGMREDTTLIIAGNR